MVSFKPFTPEVGGVGGGGGEVVMGMIFLAPFTPITLFTLGVGACEIPFTPVTPEEGGSGDGDNFHLLHLC